MSDNEQVDDLLDAVEGLDIAEEDLEQSLQQNRQKQRDLNEASAEAKMDSSLLALEAAKAAQDAATQSQEAAHASLKLSEKMREHTDELSNANFNWRQSVRNAATQLNDSKKLFVVMMVITLLLALAAVGLMGAVYYQLNNKQEQLKGEVLEVIQTENAIFKRDLTIRMDDLTAQIEANRFYVEKLANMASENKPSSSAESTETTTSEDESSVGEDSVKTSSADGAIHAIDESEISTIAAPAQKETSVTPEVVNTVDTAALEDTIQNQLQSVSKQLNEQISKLADQQQQLTEKLTHLAQNPVATQTAHNIAQLNAKQSKQLADIRWLVSQHDKHLKTISSQLESLQKAPPSEAEDSKSQLRLEAQFKQMQMQQKLIEEQLSKLQENVELIMKKVDQDKPYSYKAK